MPRTARTAARLTLLLVLPLLALACDSESGDSAGNTNGGGSDDGGLVGRDDMSTTGQEHYDRGVAEAKAAIAAGEPRLQTLGLPDFSAGELDIETGLPTQNQGCVITEEIGGYVSGWNSEMRRAVAAGELDGVSLLTKVTTREAIERRFADGSAHTIRSGGDPIAAPGGRFRIEAAPHRTLDSEYLWVIDTKSDERRELAFFSGEAKLLFEHDGGTLLLRDDGYGVYQTFDLGSALFMQGFSDP